MKLKKILLVIMLLFIVIPIAKAEDKESDVQENTADDELYLDGIIIDGTLIEGFEKDKYNYEIKLADDVKQVRIGYSYDPKFEVSTDQDPIYDTKPGKNDFKITVTSNNKSKTYTLTFIKNDTRSADASLASLTVADKSVTLSDTDEYTVEVDSNLKSAEIRATLHDKDNASFVQGYGERTENNAVALSGETTYVEVRVKAQNESVRIYKITIKKSNYKNNDASLKSLTIKEIDFNFKSNVINYNLEVENEIEKINLEALPNDTKATVNYQKEISLNEGLNEVTIQVTAEDGTERSYKLNITRKEKTNLVQNIVIEGIDFEFKPDTYEYEIKTTLTTLNFTVTLSNKEATYEVLDNEDLKNGSIVSLVIKDKDSEVTYKFKVVNDDEKIDIDTSLDDVNKEEKENNTSFFKKNEMLIGLVTLGVGIISMLGAVLTKFKNK